MIQQTLLVFTLLNGVYTGSGAARRRAKPRCVMRCPALRCVATPDPVRTRHYSELRQLVPVYCSRSRVLPGLTLGASCFSSDACLGSRPLGGAGMKVVITVNAHYKAVVALFTRRKVLK